MTTTKTLEEEIQSATERIKERAAEFDLKIAGLENKIILYTRWAWGFVIGGFAITALGIIFLLIQQ